MTRVPRPIALFLTASAAVVLLASVQAQPPQTAPLPPQPQPQTQTQPKPGGDDPAFRFKSDPFYSNGFIPTVKQLVDRILTGA